MGATPPSSSPHRCTGCSPSTPSGTRTRDLLRESRAKPPQRKRSIAGSLPVIGRAVHPAAQRQGRRLRVLQGLPPRCDRADLDSRARDRGDARLALPLRATAVVVRLVAHARSPPRTRGGRAAGRGRMAGGQRRHGAVRKPACCAPRRVQPKFTGSVVFVFWLRPLKCHTASLSCRRPPRTVRGADSRAPKFAVRPPSGQWSTARRSARGAGRARSALPRSWPDGRGDEHRLTARRARPRRSRGRIPLRLRCFSAA